MIVNFYDVCLASERIVCRAAFLQVRRIETDKHQFVRSTKIRASSIEGGETSKRASYCSDEMSNYSIYATNYRVNSRASKIIEAVIYQTHNQTSKRPSNYRRERTSTRAMSTKRSVSKQASKSDHAPKSYPIDHRIEASEHSSDQFRRSEQPHQCESIEANIEATRHSSLSKRPPIEASEHPSDQPALSK